MSKKSSSLTPYARGLGGCSYARSATGNLAAEDLHWQLHGLGIYTSDDVQKMVDTSVWLAEKAGPIQPVPHRHGLRRWEPRADQRWSPCRGVDGRFRLRADLDLGDAWREPHEVQAVGGDVKDAEVGDDCCTTRRPV